jgi:hypothetical protein
MFHNLPKQWAHTSQEHKVKKMWIQMKTTSFCSFPLKGSTKKDYRKSLSAKIPLQIYCIQEELMFVLSFQSQP